MRRCWPAAPPSCYEGKPVGTPDRRRLLARYRRIHGVKLLFTAPTAIRAIKKEDPDGVFLKKYDLSKLRGAVFWPASAADPDTHRTGLRRPAARTRWWIIGGRPKPAGPSPAIPSALGLLPSTRAGSSGKPDAWL
jgi:propionyl-CoA synthetase